MLGRHARRLALCLTLGTVAAMPLAAQSASGTAHQDSVDTSSPEAIVLAAYAAIARRPGEHYDWRRFRRLFLPSARLIPNTEQRGGAFSVLSPEEFIAWIDGVTNVGGPNDLGFTEAAVHNLVERFGDVAHVFSTYEKHCWGAGGSWGSSGTSGSGRGPCHGSTGRVG